MTAMFRKSALAAMALLVVTAQSALALTQATIPPKFTIPWGNGAGVPYIRSIPTASQIGITNCAASLTDGFPPLTFVPAGAGGCPPFGQDFNGILNQISAWARWQGAGAQIPFDAAFSATIGGYPIGAVVPSLSTQNLMWQSTVDGNTTNPDSGGAGWTGVGYMPTGAITAFGGAVAPPGYLLCFGQPVSRTTFAALFSVVGISYGAGDGSTTFNVPDLRGRTVYGPDAMGGTPANRITSAGGGFNALIGNGGGSQNQTLTQAQLPPVSPTGVTARSDIIFDTGGSSGFAGGGGILSTGSANVTISGFAGFLGQSHPILSPGQIASYIIKF